MNDKIEIFKYIIVLCLGYYMGLLSYLVEMVHDYIKERKKKKNDKLS